MFFINQNHQMRTEDYSLLLAIKRDGNIKWVSMIYTQLI
jgi:hypothetical protein